MAQDEQSARAASVSDRYWSAPRIQSEPPTLAPKVASQLAQALTIENETLQVTWVRGKVSVGFKSSTNLFLDGNFPIMGGFGRQITVSDKTFGQGQGIEISYLDGSRDTLMLFPKQPFLFLRTSFTNSDAQPLVISFVRPFQADVKLSKPAAQLKAFGSAGLTALDKNPGSYDWLAVVEPESRNGVVFGYLTSERGCGVLFDKVDGDAVRVGAQIDYGRLVIAPGKSAESETLAIGYFDDARLGLEAYADAIAKNLNIHLPSQPTVYCTWYSQPHGGAADENYFYTNAMFLEKNLSPFGFSVAQIDDGWQSGFKRTSPSSPKKGFLTNNPSGSYPSGMKATAGNIKSLGLKPGIWFMPFAGTSADPYFTNHLDWFAKTPDGQPYDTSWGGTCLDMTYDPAREHTREVVNRICNEWGYQYIKIDGLWTGT
ncbi:MAG TPA: alpha-galactosidase, partial [Candidatus Baltobacteraceae bacterium]|nr:alpha-galactosidase [Candidatus Baltobacteraceae bacterium]